MFRLFNQTHHCQNISCVKSIAKLKDFENHNVSTILMLNLSRIKRKPIECFETFASNENKKLMRFHIHHSTQNTYIILYHWVANL